MTLTLLLDLDDTLINTNLVDFVPAYFQALAKELAPQVSPDLMFQALISGARLMNESEDFTQTLEEIFNKEFFPQINNSRDSLEAEIQKFYDEVFPTLSGLTSPNPEAKPFVEWAFSQGYRVAIATDPLLPRKATYHRLRWAGFEPEQFELISTYEHFHFSKTHPAYYAEFLGRMGWPEGAILMVGNDMDRDISPAKKLGLSTYHVNEGAISKPGPEAGRGGNLDDLRLWLESADFSDLIPSFKSVTAVMAILSATPAVMNGFTSRLELSRWSRSVSPADWTLTELVCHLRDTEREIHQMQINLFSEQSEPFIPRPDTSVWASHRDYLHEDGKSALREFNDARRKTLVLLDKITAEGWGRKARHAIFGPTNFLEVVGFIAEHDRMHLQQAWGILGKI